MTTGFRRTLFKHFLSEGRDCPIEWMADFASMCIRLRAEFISPTLIFDCIQHIARADERFILAGINTPIQIGNRFKFQFQVGRNMNYQVNGFQLKTGSDRLDRPEIELIPVHKVNV